MVKLKITNGTGSKSQWPRKKAILKKLRLDWAISADRKTKNGGALILGAALDRHGRRQLGLYCNTGELKAYDFSFA